MSEFDPMEELGLTHDKQLLCSCKGFLLSNDGARGLCKRFVQKGDRFYDIMSRYVYVHSYVLSNSGGSPRDLMRCLTPFLKAFGITDYGAMTYSKSIMRFMPDAKKVIGQITNTLPTFITTTAYEHDVMNMCSALEIPRGIVDCTEVNFDGHDIGRNESRHLRELEYKISQLRLSNYEYTPNEPMALTDDDVKMIDVIDRIFQDELENTGAMHMMREMKSVGCNEKAYFLLDIRKRTQIDLEGTAYIGGDMTDFNAMELIRDNGGLSLSFNGCGPAVRGSNIAVMSRDCTVAAVIAQEFYDRGMEAVYDLVENWNREKLMKRSASLPHLVRGLLSSSPRKLPEVHIVDSSNVSEIAQRSEKYRRELLLR